MASPPHLLDVGFSALGHDLCSHCICDHSIPPQQNDVHTRQTRIRSQTCHARVHSFWMTLSTPQRDFADEIKVRGPELGTLSRITQAQFYPESLKSETLSCGEIHRGGSASTQSTGAEPCSWERQGTDSSPRASGRKPSPADTWIQPGGPGLASDPRNRRITHLC